MGKPKKKKNARAEKKKEKENTNQDDLHRQQREYWNNYYGKQGREEDFYKDEWDVSNFIDIISFLSPLGRKEDTLTLVPGCGMSSLSKKLHLMEHCKFKVVNVDISKKVIEEMEKLDKENNWNMSWEEMSMDKMDKFQNESFDVIIDKAASDFIVPPDPKVSAEFQEQRLKFIANYLSEVQRLLKVGGAFIYFLALEVRGEHEKTCLDSMLVYFRRGWDVIIHGPDGGKLPIKNGKLNMVVVFFTKKSSQGNPSTIKWDIHIDSDPLVGKTLELFQVVQLENEERGFLSTYSDEDPNNKCYPNNKWILKSLENVSSHRRLHFNLGEYEGLENDIMYNALLFDSPKDDESQSHNYSVLCVPEKILGEWHTLSREDQRHFFQRHFFEQLNTTRLLMIFSRKWSNASIDWKGHIGKYFSSLEKLAPKKRDDEVVIWWFGGTSFSCVEQNDFQSIGRVKLEREGGNHKFITDKQTTGKNFLGKANTEAQPHSLSKKTRDEETSPKETKDHSVLVEEVNDYDDVLSEDSNGDDYLDEGNYFHEAPIRFCLDYFNDMGITETSRMLEKESGYFNKRHFKDLVQCGRWKLLEDYLSHFFDIGKSMLLSKIETWAFMDDLKSGDLPLPEEKWFEPDYPRKESIISVPALIRRNLETRDELNLPQESYLRSQLTDEGSNLVSISRQPSGERKHDVLIEDNTGIDHLDEEDSIRFFLDYFNEMGFTETSRMFEKESRYFSKRHFEDLVQHGRWKLLGDYLSHCFHVDSALLSKIKTWAFMDDLKIRGLPLPEPKWFEPDYPQKASIISVLPELIPGKLKKRDELKLPSGSELLRHVTQSPITCKGSDHLVSVRRRPPGETKDEYQKFEKMTIFHTIIGKGKFTNVREGEYEKKQVAIKCIDLDCGVPICERELSNLQELEGHENVVKYFGVEGNEDSQFIALEKCSFSLQDLFDEEKNFGIEIKSTWDPAYHPPTMLLSLIKDMLLGLDYLHSNDLIHRNLKPSNIMIKEEHGKFCAKLSDLSLSKHLEGTSSAANTPVRSRIDVYDIWKAPEQKKKDGNVGRYVDLYSLGYIIHFCLTGGKHPQDVVRNADLENCSINKLLFKLRKFPEAYDIVSQLMSREKNDRPSAKDVLKHPFCWDFLKRNEFMRRASDWLDKERVDHENSNTTSDILEELKGKKEYICGTSGTWDDKIDADFVTYLRKCEPRVKFWSVFDLVRVIRNKSDHFLDLPQNVKDLIPGGSANRLEEYFVRKFPRLLLEVYKIVLKFWKDDPTLKLYLP